MYPKVKVKEQEEDDPIAVYLHEGHLESFAPLSVHDLNSSVENEDNSPRSVVRIPKSYISNSATPMTPLFKGEGKSDNKEKDVEDSKPNVKATSILRPRAVLSSPDNDGVIGNRNKAKAEQPSGLKNQKSCENRHHTRCSKVIPKRSANGNSITKKVESKEAAESKSKLKGGNSITKKVESKEAAESKSELKCRRRATIADPRQGGHLRKGKPDSEVKFEVVRD